MRRRTFLAAVPAVAAATALDAQGAGPPRGDRGPRGAPPSGDDGGKRGRAPLYGGIDRPDVRSGDRVVGASWGTRSAVYGANGGAACAHPLATLAGLDVLRKGGSAVDAAIAINACLGFLEPTACGIGGDVYALIWNPKTRKVEGLAGSGRSPRTLSLATVRQRSPNGTIPAFGAVSVSVPGAVDGWWTMHQRHGRLKWAELFDPAIGYATEGVPVSPVVAEYLGLGVRALRRTDRGVEESANALRTFAPDGEPPREGQIFRNPDLARTYQAIAKGGRDAFYDGAIADTIERYFKRIGGWMTRADLAAQRAKWTDPASTNYRGVTVHAIAENTQGIATLQMLNMLERFDMGDEGFLSARSIHLQVEAKRLAYEDRARYYADPEFAKVPAAWLLSKDYAAERAALISPRAINRDVKPGKAPWRGDTTYFTVADKDGLMVSIIQSNFRGMGSGLVADGLGFMFQDRGQLFSLTDGHPNLYAPGKRPFQTIIPGFATAGSEPWLSFGVMGGDMQPQGQVQIILDRVDYGIDNQGAGDAPRWHHEGSSETMGEDGGDEPATGLLRLESGVPRRTRAGLQELGWTIGGSDGGFGRYHCVERLRQPGPRVYSAAADPRADGTALAY